MIKRFRDSYMSYALLYSCYYAGTGLTTVLIAIYLQDMGFHATQTSLVVSMAYVMSMVAQPFAGKILAKYDVKTVNLVFLGLAAASSVIFIFCKNLYAIILIYGFIQAMMNCACPVVERMGTRCRFSYGKVRIWGTVGYSVSAQLAGLIYSYIAPYSLFICAAVSMVLCAISLNATVEIVPQTTAKSEVRESKKVGYGFLKTNPNIVLYVVISSIFVGVTNIGHTYCAPMFRAEKIPVNLVSTILLVAGFCEMPFILFSYKFMNRIANKLLLWIIYGATLIQMLAYGMHAPVILMILVTFIAKHPAAMVNNMTNLKVMECLVSEEEQLPALSLVYMGRNLMTFATQIMAGQILQNSSYDTLFLVVSGIALVGMLLLVPFRVSSGNNKMLFQK